MKVPDSEGIANHAVPESCVRSRREARHEALTGVRVGQPSSRDSNLSWVPTLLRSRKATRSGALLRVSESTRRGLRPWHARTLLAREPGDLQRDRRRPYGPAARIGKVRNRSR